MLTLEQLVLHVDELPALPDTAVKVLKLVDDPNASTRAVCGALAADVALTSKVLKIANSAYYGMPRSIGTVNDAVLILGMKTVRNLALAAAAHDVLQKEIPGYQLAAGELWRHSISCAIACDIVAARSGKVKPEEAFVAGLLHDVGKVVLNVQVAPQFQAIMSLAELDAIPFHEAERSMLGYDHAEVGAKVGESWNLPAPLCCAIAGHHSIAKGADAPGLTAAVHVANWIVLTEIAEMGRAYGKVTVEPEAIELLGVDESEADEIREEMHLRLADDKLAA